MNVRIERVEKANTHILDNVAAEVFDYAVAPVHLAAFLDQPTHMMCVAVAGDLVVGQVQAMVHFHPDQPPELYVDNLGVSPDYRRRGIGRALLEEMTSLGKARGCEDTWLGTEADNEPALALYRKVGLKEQPMVMFEREL